MLVPELLYLDTARLGRICATARRAVRNFAGLTSEVGLPLYGPEFLRIGFAALPITLQRRFPGLCSWHGITSLKQTLRRLLNNDTDEPVLLAQRSTQLMRSTARQLFHRCRNVLVTDLDWPGYRSVLEHERSNQRMTSVRLRDAIQRDLASHEEIVHTLISTYRREECDGLYLTAVSHDGIRLPINELVQRIAKTSRIEMVIVDGAQDFCHESPIHDTDNYDVYIAGCHKWMRAAQPLGIAMMGQRSNSDSIFLGIAKELSHGDFEDPLFRFSRQIESQQLDGHTETVNVWPLMTCAGAVQEAWSQRSIHKQQNRRQHLNADLVTDIARQSGWFPLIPDEKFRTGIVVLEHPHHRKDRPSAFEISRLFHEHGISLTAYDEGQIRLSMPKWPLAGCDIDRLRHSLRRAA